MSAKDEDRSFLQRPLAVVTLVGGVLGIVTALVSLLPRGGDAEETQSRIDVCVTAHGLSQPSESEKVAPGRLLFRACDWPPPSGAATDGFSEITVASRDGPGQSEAGGLTIADVFTTECRDIEATYLFDNQGTFVVEKPVLLTKGEIRRIEGGSVWRPRTAEEASIFAPRRDESIVLSNARYTLDSARCV